MLFSALRGVCCIRAGAFLGQGIIVNSRARQRVAIATLAGLFVCVGGVVGVVGVNVWDYV